MLNNYCTDYLYNSYLLCIIGVFLCINVTINILHKNIDFKKWARANCCLCKYMSICVIKKVRYAFYLFIAAYIAAYSACRFDYANYAQMAKSNRGVLKIITLLSVFVIFRFGSNLYLYLRDRKKYNNILSSTIVLSGLCAIDKCVIALIYAFSICLLVLYIFE